MADALDPLVALLYLVPPEKLGTIGSTHFTGRFASIPKAQSAQQHLVLDDGAKRRLRLCSSGKNSRPCLGAEGRVLGNISGRFYLEDGSSTQRHSFEVQRVFRYEVSGGLIQQTHRLIGEMRSSRRSGVAVAKAILSLGVRDLVGFARVGA